MGCKMFLMCPGKFSNPAILSFESKPIMFMTNGKSGGLKVIKPNT
jgi:hypothetical protein